MKYKFNKLGLSFALIHIFAIALLVSVVDADQQPWFWMIFLIYDFPISLLRNSGLEPIYFHLIIGSMWWYFIPVFFAKLKNIINSNGKNENT